MVCSEDLLNVLLLQEEYLAVFDEADEFPVALRLFFMRKFDVLLGFKILLYFCLKNQINSEETLKQQIVVRSKLIEEK